MREVADTALRLTDEEFARLIQAEGAAAPALADVSPGVLVALEAVQAPLAAVQVEVSSRRQVQQHQLWVNESCLGMLLDVKDEERQFNAAPPDLLPSSIARLIRLGPRRVGAREARIAEPEIVEDLHDEMSRSCYEGRPSTSSEWTGPGGSKLHGQVTASRLPAWTVLTVCGWLLVLLRNWCLNRPPRPPFGDCLLGCSP